MRARLGGRGMRHSDREWCGRRLWLAGLGGSLFGVRRGGGGDLPTSDSTLVLEMARTFVYVSPLECAVFAKVPVVY